MKKILIFCLISLVLTSCINNKENKINEINNTSLTNTGNNENTKEKELTPEEKIEIKKEQISTIKKKLQLKGLIIKGNIDYGNKEYTNALIKYLQIYKEVPNDKATIKTLGDIYFNLKNFKQSYKYYSKIVDYNKIDKNDIALSLIYSTNLDKDNLKILFEELANLGLSKDELFYYRASLVCEIDFDLCIEKYEEYFNNKKIEEEEKITDETEIIDENKIIDNENTEIERFKILYNIEKAIESYNNFQVDDLDYKKALVIGAFFENKLYPIAISASKKILSEKEDYKPLIKIIAKSYYEIGNYIDAKVYLVKYNKLVKEDPEISFFIGVIYSKLNEYVLSSIHFKKALKIGYEDSLEIYKWILVNYYDLGDIDKMLSIFDIIINDYESEINENDYSMAIYYNIINDEISYAKDITKKALDKFPESKTFNGYMGWIILEEINSKGKTIQEQVNSDIISSSGSQLEDKLYIDAEKYIIKGLEIDSEDPMLNLIKGKLEMSKGNLREAYNYLNKTYGLDKNGDFGKIAEEDLKLIKVKK